MRLHCILLLICITLQGCAKHTYEEMPVSTAGILERVNTWSVNNPALNAFLKANAVTLDAKNNLFSMKRLFLTGLFYDPAMQVTYKKWKQAKIVLDHSDYKINPEFSFPFEHHSDTSDGRSKWTIGSVLSFIYERKSKQEARQAKAEVKLLNASIEIERYAMERYGVFEEKYHAYVIKQATLSEIRNENGVLRELLAQLKNKYELGAVSQFELNSTKLELQQGLFKLSIQENELEEIADELLSMTHLVYPELENIEIEFVSPLRFARKTYEESNLFSFAFAEIQRIMLESHLDILIKLNEYAQAEATLRLKIEQQYPDIVLSPGFIFDQSDNIWSLGASWVLPLFENTRQNLDILTALEQRKIKQQEIVSLQKELLNALYKRYRSVIRHKSSIVVSDTLIESIQQRAKEIEEQIKIGGLDSIALLRNRKEFYQARQEQIAVYNDAINAMLEFEHLLHSSHSDININDVVSSWLRHIEENNNEPVN